MSIITEEYSVNLTLGNSYPQRLRLVQNDNGRLFKFTLYNGATQYIPDTANTVVTFEGTCPDGSGYTLDCTINSNGTVQVRPTKKVTGICGKGWARIVVTKSDQLIGSAEFDVVVERAGYDPTAPTPTPTPSPTSLDYRLIQTVDLTEEVNVIEISNISALNSLLFVIDVPAVTSSANLLVGTTSKGYQLGYCSSFVGTSRKAGLLMVDKYSDFVLFGFSSNSLQYSGNTFNNANRQMGICRNQGKSLSKIYLGLSVSSLNFPVGTHIEVYAR